MHLLEPLSLGSKTARNRVVFGPHETNLARRRAISERHVAYYRRRAVGGAGMVVVEEASVHVSDWPYERCPLAAHAGWGWSAIADACHDEGTLAVAGLGHSGGQGSSAYNQAPLWAPSRVPEVNAREVPKWMEAADIGAVVEGFRSAARMAADTGLDGVEVNAGQHSLIRQFLSGLTNHRDDAWGQDKLRFARDVLTAVRRGLGPEGILGLRLSCDELAPWAGLTPETAIEVAAALAVLPGIVDYVTVVRGSIYTVSATRPDGHVPAGFNLDLTRAVRAGVLGSAVLGGAVPGAAVPGGARRARVGAPIAVIAQGSIVDVGQAEWAVSDGVCDGVEMTRAQIADADLVAKAARGEADRIRPCLLCNQTCQVRDSRNPIVTCVVDPLSGHELEEAAVDLANDKSVGEHPTEVLVVGGGIAGMETARVAAMRGHRVVLAERAERLGGTIRVAAAGHGRDRLAVIADWLEAECRALGVKVEFGREVIAGDLVGVGGPVVLATGSLPGARRYDVVETGAIPVLSAAEVLAGSALPETGPVAVRDPIGGPIGVSVAEGLAASGRAVHLIVTDLIAGNELSRSGDLAPSNVRLLGAGVVIEKRSILRTVGVDGVVVEDRFTGERRTIPVTVLVDAGHRLPDDRLWRETGGYLPRAGDAVAPRTIHEAILEGRRVALALAAPSTHHGDHHGAAGRGDHP